MFPRHLIAIVTAVMILTHTTACANPSTRNSATIAPSPEETVTDGKAGWLRDLNLTQEQFRQIQQIRNRYRNQLTQQRQQVQQAQQALRAMMIGNAATADIKQKYTELATLKQQFATTRFNILLEIREVLTPTQRQQLGDRLQRGKSQRRFRGDL